MEYHRWSRATEIRLIDEIERQLGSPEWTGPTAINWAALTALGSWPDEDNKNALKNRWSVMRSRLGVPGDRQGGPAVRHVIFDELRAAVRDFYENGRTKKRRGIGGVSLGRDSEAPSSESEAPPTKHTPPLVVVARKPLSTSQRRWLSWLEQAGADTVLAVGDVELDPCALGRALSGSGPFDEALLISLAGILLAPAIDSGFVRTAGLVQMHMPRERWVCCATAAGWTATWDPCGASSGRDPETRALLARVGRKVEEHVCISLPPRQGDDSDYLSVLSACLALAKSRNVNAPPAHFEPLETVRAALVSELSFRVGERPILLFAPPDYCPWPQAVGLLERLLAPLQLRAEVKRATPMQFAQVAADGHRLRVVIEPAGAPRTASLYWKPKPDERSYCFIARDQEANQYAPVLQVEVDAASPRVLRVNWAPGAAARRVVLNGRRYPATSASLVLAGHLAKLEFSVDRLRVSLTIDGLAPEQEPAAGDSSGETGGDATTRIQRPALGVPPPAPAPRLAPSPGPSEATTIAPASAPAAATSPGPPRVASPDMGGAPSAEERERSLALRSRLTVELFGSDPEAPSGAESSSRGDSFDDLPSDHQKERLQHRRRVRTKRAAASAPQDTKD